MLVVLFNILNILCNFHHHVIQMPFITGIEPDRCCTRFEGNSHRLIEGFGIGGAGFDMNI
ncbi:hypothetical protein D3C81_1948130 [compost metagenome]